MTDLEAILPTAEEVGKGYQVQPSTDDDSGSDDVTDAAIEAACPGLEEAFGDIGDENEDSNVAEVAMLDQEGRGFEVKVNAEPTLDPETVDEKIDMVNGCDVIKINDENDSDITIHVDAERIDDFGEVGVDLTMDMTVENDALSTPYEISFIGRTFLVGTVSVTVTVIDGGDPETFETIPADIDLLDEFSAEMETRVTDLLAG